MAATACGTDSPDSTGGVQANDNSNVKFTGSPIKVMTMSPISGNIVVQSPIDAAVAYANKVNAKGGVNGHELKVISCDEAFDPNKAQACAQQAVDEGVVAVVGGFSSSAASVLPVLEKAKIPWVGPAGLTAEELSSKVSYPLTPGALAFAGLGARAAQDGCATTAVLRYDVPAAEGAVSLVGAGLASAGKKVDSDIKVPTTTTDFSSIAQQASKSACQILTLPPEQGIGVAAAGAQLGLKNRYYAVSGALTDEALKSAGAVLEGTISAVPFPVKENPVWDEARAAVPKPTPGWSSPYTQNGWAAYAALVNVASTIDGDITAASLIAALNKATAVNTDGITDPLDFTKEFPVPGMNRVFNTKVIFEKAENGAIVQDGDFVDIAPLMGG